MSGIVLRLTIIDGMEEAWRRFCQELSNSRKAAHEESRIAHGIKRERLALIKRRYGSVVIATFEADDLGQAMTNFLMSNLPFDHWYREQIKNLHGVDLSGYSSTVQQTSINEEQRTHFEWTLPPHRDNRSGRHLS